VDVETAVADMATRQRLWSQPTDDWQQLQLRVGFPEQETSELLRPIVLFGQTAAAWVQVTGVSERLLDRQAALSCLCADG
jgi:hypothetical protein